jgi:hypothetical protein
VFTFIIHISIIVTYYSVSISFRIAFIWMRAHLVVEQTNKREEDDCEMQQKKALIRMRAVSILYYIIGVAL